MSNVEIASIGMRARASGAAIAARTPVASNGIGPETSRQRKPCSRRRSTAAGAGPGGPVPAPSKTARSCWQTIESSLSVRVIEWNPVRPSGTFARGGRRTTANRPDRTRSVSFILRATSTHRAARRLGGVHRVRLGASTTELSIAAGKNRYCATAAPLQVRREEYFYHDNVPFIVHPTPPRRRCTLV